MSVITQSGHSALIWAARWGNTEIVVELVEAKANLDLQNEVRIFQTTCTLYMHCTCILYVVLPFIMHVRTLYMFIRTYTHVM